LADEPTGALDSKTSQEILDLFVELNKNDNKTVLIITHDPTVSEQCKRIVTLKDGKIIANET
jgi:putative ABC transport system ATP-binding protein